MLFVKLIVSEKCETAEKEGNPFAGLCGVCVLKFEAKSSLKAGQTLLLCYFTFI